LKRLPQTESPCNAENADTSRHERIAGARRGPRHLSPGAGIRPRNTLEAYRASLSWGPTATRSTFARPRDGVLVCFHDDMLDHMLDAFGDVADYDWTELKTFAFAGPGQSANSAGSHARRSLRASSTIRGLLHLDVKGRVRGGDRPAVDEPTLWTR